MKEHIERKLVVLRNDERICWETLQSLTKEKDLYSMQPILTSLQRVINKIR